MNRRGNSIYAKSTILDCGIMHLYKSSVKPLTIKGKYGIIIVPRGSRTLPNGNECTSSKRQLEMPDVRDHEMIFQDFQCNALGVFFS